MIDILDLEYSSKGRDVDISEPILSYLENKYNLKIVRRCCYKNWQYYLLKYKPKIVFIANGIGSLHHFNIVKTAYYLGLKVVTHLSEGDLSSGEKFSSFSAFFWGFNKDEVLYEDLHLEWSQKNVDLAVQYSGQASKIKLSGAVGFDKYILLKNYFLQKEVFLNKYNKSSFRKIVGIAGWGFDVFIQESLGIYRPYEVIDFFSEENKRNVVLSKDLVNELLRETIIKNPDVLFILKQHPILGEECYSEFKGLYEYTNTLLLKTEEAIYDVINVCDIWGAYESTTNMEAWLIGNKPTFLIQPIENDFNRSGIAAGSSVVRTGEDLNAFIEEYYEKGKVSSFEQLESKREKIITNMIQWSDGKNHQRAAEYVYELYNAPISRKPKLNFYLIRIYSRFIYKKFTKQIRKLLRLTVHNDGKYFDAKEREEWHQIYLKAIKDFHK